MKVTVTSNGAVTLPADFRRRDGIKSGAKFDLQRIAPGQYVLTKVRPRAKLSLVDWLLDCPENDWFRPLPCTETTDSIKSPFED